jgi:catechol 2,3-dioxygenase-like lactoylglutathione lyase family enzyme
VIAHFILYVADQSRSTAFYRELLATEPRLFVPGMTEIELSPGSILGLMPESGIRRLLGERLPDPASANGIPRSELYLLVEGAEEYCARAARIGARELSGLAQRDWGHRVAYYLDPDGHVLAIASL